MGGRPRQFQAGGIAPGTARTCPRFRVSSQLQDTAPAPAALLPWGAGGTDPALWGRLHGENRAGDGQAAAVCS